MLVFPFEVYSEEYDPLMKKLTVSSSGISIMKDRFKMKSFMISDISTPAANVVKQHVLSLGGEAAVPAYSVNCSNPKADLIFSVREDRLPALLEKFRCQCWKLPEVAEKIERLIINKPPWFSFSSEKFNTESPLIMGILNVTPDSFSDGGKFAKFENAVSHAEKMILDGADIVDIGGESTRPGAATVEESDEIKRVVPVIKAIREKFPSTAISIDTTKSRVAEAALDAGADIVNDISGLTFDTNMAVLAAERKAPVVIMHILGTPKTMQNNPVYDNFFTETLEFLNNSIEIALSKGVRENSIILDPGICFGKDLNHNIAIIKHLEVYHSFAMPLLAGVSRKSMIAKITGRDDPMERTAGTVSLNTKLLEKGVAVIRVHDIKEAKDCVAVHNAMRDIKCF
ncbi:MAG TPA: dihydropteroate synthase [bacterium]|nr:dihydropteroate synthase [bacterium]HOB70388.1 dihydropteroate synthase [bacterium]HOG43174.1 dihydropteroate synthase [bacterium]HPM46170.1 dihydropteroate synthase [bacterium]HPV20122.1 dihydropteroate synthase [bacterium]